MDGCLRVWTVLELGGFPVWGLQLFGLGASRVGHQHDTPRCQPVAVGMLRHPEFLFRINLGQLGGWKVPVASMP